MRSLCCPEGRFWVVQRRPQASFSSEICDFFRPGLEVSITDIYSAVGCELILFEICQNGSSVLISDGFLHISLFKVKLCFWCNEIILQAPSFFFPLWAKYPVLIALWKEKKKLSQIICKAGLVTKGNYYYFYTVIGLCQWGAGCWRFRGYYGIMQRFPTEGWRMERCLWAAPELVSWYKHTLCCTVKWSLTVTAALPVSPQKTKSVLKNQKDGGRW